MMKATTTKTDLVESLLPKLDKTRKEVQELVDHLFEMTKDTLSNGEDIKLPGFGNFRVREKRERAGRNPKTGAKIPITARKVVTFRPSTILRERVNNSK